MSRIMIALMIPMIFSPMDPAGISGSHFLKTEMVSHGLPPVVSEVPETIDVWITGRAECAPSMRYQTVTVDFKEYVKIVLANEFGYDWDPDALRAGAIAVKMYAWTYIERGGKFSGVDVIDCDWDQVYDPALRFPETDRAVDETWDYKLIRKSDGRLFRTHHLAWMGGCAVIDRIGHCMGQWNSKADADAGMDWRDILAKYYRGSRVVPVRTWVEIPPDAPTPQESR